MFEEGCISYSQPFDMLNAEDRLKVANLLILLGFDQDQFRYKYHWYIYDDLFQVLKMSILDSLVYKQIEAKRWRPTLNCL